MRIRIKLDDYELPDINNIREKWLFEIFWECDGTFYPTEHWVDFGCILLGWWVSTVIKLLRGEDESSFAFMDGPYSLSAKIDRNSRKLTLNPRGIDSVWELDLVLFIEVLNQAINIVYKNLSATEGNEEDKAIFRRYSEILQESLLDLQKAS